MSLKIEITGLGDTKRMLKETSRKVKVASRRALVKSAVFVQGEVKESIAGNRSETKSVDTGRFLNSIGFDIGKDSASVSPGVPYADFLEYGSSKFTGRKHFSNSGARSKRKVIEIFDKEIKS